MLSSVSVDNTSRLPTQPLSAVQVWSCHAWARIESAVQPVLDVVLPRNPVTKCRQIRIVPTWVENTLGVMNYDSLCPLYRTSRNAQLNAAVSDVGARLVEHCDRKELDFEFRVLKDDNVVNAFCLPGGKIAITTGLLDKLQHESVGDAELDALPFEDKLAAVLGHEITHACAGHGASRLQWGLLLTMVAKVSNFMVERWIVSQEEDREESRRRVSASKREQNALAARRKGQVFGWVTEMFLRLAGTLMLQKHGRCHEFQSDMVGMKYAQFAGYDPRGAIWLQKLFVQMHGDRSIPVVELFASHPPSKDRVERCEHTYHRLQNGETDSIY